MRKIIFAISAAGMMLLSSNAYCGYGHQGKTYTALNLGYGLQDHKMEFSNGQTGSLKNSGSGLLGQLALGYYLLDEFRLDMQVHYDRGYKFKKDELIGANNLTGRGKDPSFGVFWNASYDLLNASNFTPYAMLGLGFLRTEYKAIITKDGTQGKANKTKYNSAYQAGLGLAYHAGSSVDIDFGYRYISREQFTKKKSGTANNKTDFNMTLTSPALSAKVKAGAIQAGIIGLRITY